jgi:hypothetical protein
MAAASIPALNSRESDNGWFAELIQIARHCDTASRISANPENKRMQSESTSWRPSIPGILRLRDAKANGPTVPPSWDFRMALGIIGKLHRMDEVISDYLQACSFSTSLTTARSILIYLELGGQKVEKSRVHGSLIVPRMKKWARDSGLEFISPQFCFVENLIDHLGRM